MAEAELTSKDTCFDASNAPQKGSQAAHLNSSKINENGLRSKQLQISTRAPALDYGEGRGSLNSLKREAIALEADRAALFIKEQYGREVLEAAQKARKLDLSQKLGKKDAVKLASALEGQNIDLETLREAVAILKGEAVPAHLASQAKEMNSRFKIDAYTTFTVNDKLNVTLAQDSRVATNEERQREAIVKALIRESLSRCEPKLDAEERETRVDKAFAWLKRIHSERGGVPSSFYKSDSINERFWAEMHTIYSEGIVRTGPNANTGQVVEQETAPSSPGRIASQKTPGELKPGFAEKEQTTQQEVLSPPKGIEAGRSAIPVAEDPLREQKPHQEVNQAAVKSPVKDQEPPSLAAPAANTAPKEEAAPKEKIAAPAAPKKEPPAPEKTVLAKEKPTFTEVGAKENVEKKEEQKTFAPFAIPEWSLFIDAELQRWGYPSGSGRDVALIALYPEYRDKVYDVHLRPDEERVERFISLCAEMDEAQRAQFAEAYLLKSQGVIPLSRAREKFEAEHDDEAVKRLVAKVGPITQFNQQVKVDEPSLPDQSPAADKFVLGR